MKEIREWTGVTPEKFHNEIKPLGTPAVLRGLVKDWPVVQAGRTSAKSFCDYLTRFDRGYQFNTIFGPPSIKGRFFYNNDLSGFNFQKNQTPMMAGLDYILSHLETESPPALAIQSMPVHESLPGFTRENTFPILKDAVEPRIWINNEVRVAAHYDPSENLACVVAGRRQFVLFPPSQVENLYIGPFELTPSGAVVSMVDIQNPDFDAYPKFSKALEAALYADLEPGDAIYIPYLWWHAVHSKDKLNALVNYWWSALKPEHGNPNDAFLHAMISLKDLPEHNRAAWRELFEHYVFQQNGDIAQHIPENRRGILAKMTTEAISSIRGALARALSQGSR